MKTTIRTTYRIKLEVLSPLFIGSGKEYSTDEYFIVEDREENNDLLHRFDSSDIFEVFSPKEQQEIIEINTKPLEVRKRMNILLQKYFADKKIIPKYSMVVNEHTAKTFYENVRKESQNNDSNQLIIKEFVQNSFDKKYIPGSGIKGAISTAFQEISASIKTGFQGDYNDLMITDSQSVNIDCFEVQKLRRKGGKAELPADYEIMISGNAEFYIKLKNNGKFSKENIIGACKKYAEKQIEYSLKFIQKRKEDFEKHPPKNGQEKSKQESYKALEEFFKETLPKKDHGFGQNNNSFLLNLGFGGISVFKMLSLGNGGSYSWKVPKSGEPISVENFPSTFWMTDQQMPLGWVKCVFLD